MSYAGARYHHSALHDGDDLSYRVATTTTTTTAMMTMNVDDTGIFISRRTAATTTTTTIGNNEQLVSDGKASCTSALHVASRESDDELP
jgi:hypothetical protein